jgi:hypothetical protein
MKPICNKNLIKNLIMGGNICQIVLCFGKQMGTDITITLDTILYRMVSRVIFEDMIKLYIHFLSRPSLNQKEKIISPFGSSLLESSCYLNCTVVDALQWNTITTQL